MQGQYLIEHLLSCDEISNLNFRTCRDRNYTVDISEIFQIEVMWWRHQMETFSALLALCAGDSPGSPVNLTSQRPVTLSFDVFFDKLLSKQSWGWWSETPSRSLWRHCSAMDSPHIRSITQKAFPSHAMDMCYIRPMETIRIQAGLLTSFKIIHKRGELFRRQ